MHTVEIVKVEPMFLSSPTGTIANPDVGKVTVVIRPTLGWYTIGQGYSKEEAEQDAVSKLGEGND